MSCIPGMQYLLLAAVPGASDNCLHCTCPAIYASAFIRTFVYFVGASIIVYDFVSLFDIRILIYLFYGPDFTAEIVFRITC